MISFVVPPVALSDLAPDYRAAPPYTRPKVDTQVVIGIFPASVVHIVPGPVNDDGTLATAFEDAMRDGEAKLTREIPDANGAPGVQPTRALAELPEEEGDELQGYTLQPEEQDEIVDVTVGVDEARRQELPPTLNGITRPHRPKSLLLDGRKPPTMAVNTSKPQPPVPTITAGDSTMAGQAWPLVDEIACAIREWHEVSRSRTGYG